MPLFNTPVRTLPRPFAAHRGTGPTMAGTEAPARQTSVAPTAPMFRVLAVDDDSDTLEIIRYSLGADFEVLTLANPIDIYAMIDLFEPDLIILDVMMPKINGLQVLEILQKNPRVKDLPVMILSAKSAPSDIKQGYQVGASLYLTKPFEPARLLKNVKSHFADATELRGKTLPMEAIAMQLANRPAYRSGHIRIASPTHR